MDLKNVRIVKSYKASLAMPTNQCIQIGRKITFFKWAIPGLFFFIFYKQSCRWLDLIWCRKQPLYQLSHNHCPTNKPANQCRQIRRNKLTERKRKERDVERERERERERESMHESTRLWIFTPALVTWRELLIFSLVFELKNSFVSTPYEAALKGSLD